MKPVKKKDDSDYTVKIVIVGDSGVGKTNILCRFCKGEFKNNYVSTIGVDFKNMVIPVRNSKIRLQIWDTAGQERFKNINQTYFKGAMAVVLTYSIVDEQSFDNVGNTILIQKTGSSRFMSIPISESSSFWPPINQTFPTEKSHMKGEKVLPTSFPWISWKSAQRKEQT